MLPALKRNISRYVTNMYGWQTNRHIVVIESDDWGSIRMPSKEVYNKCLKAGYRVDQIAYERYDSLASEDDLELLFDSLSSFTDCKGNSAVLTANILTANPDFEKIKAADYQEYFYESVSDTFKRYPKHANCLALWQTGEESGVFFPQSHGREHLNVSLFMNALRQDDNDVLFGFEHEMPGCIPKGEGKGGNRYVESLRFIDEEDKKEKLKIILEGLDQFANLMGYRSESFIPPNYIWSPDFNEEVAKKGVRYYQGRRKMKEPLFGGAVRLNSYKLGEENRFGQRYLIRNAFFEPVRSDNSIDNCLKDIYTSFKMKKPAVICTHRLNYVGFIDEKNRDKNLRLLNKLLTEIKKKWPRVEFMNSVKLGKLIEIDYERGL